jgi:hypothetical protein
MITEDSRLMMRKSSVILIAGMLRPPAELGIRLAKR